MLTGILALWIPGGLSLLAVSWATVGFGAFGVLAAVTVIWAVAVGTGTDLPGPHMVRHEATRRPS